MTTALLIVSLLLALALGIYTEGNLQCNKTWVLEWHDAEGNVQPATLLRAKGQACRQAGYINSMKRSPGEKRGFCVPRRVRGEELARLRQERDLQG